ncbi:hypothetical protein CPC16_008206 [Podila verticillata]|uniref:F-box domain-containing protein n=1 Tax=Podila verticillata NRRL 6337 TaxID=1069443 RepID=A0A086TMA1_9FUNG|nr:hypothetical protein CPC16_008206 [Podila verticillata]KFH63078.1 hypothetical protein MVEG_11115 [Podila verticillata NRRL 6337]
MNIWRIPIETLNDQSRHFRHVIQHRPWPSGTLQATRLHTLETTAEALVQDPRLLINNSHLSELWLSPGNTQYRDVRPVIESLSQLRHIYLYGFMILGDDHLSGFFNNNPGLQDLSMSYVQGITAFKGCQPLINLTSLYLNNVWQYNPGLVRLFELCPSLETLSLAIDFETPAELLEVLPNQCPKLKSIKLLDYQDGGHYSLLEDDAVSWIEAPSRLVSFTATAPTFTNAIYQAFLRRSETLETLKLKFCKSSRYNAVNTGKLLANCPNLRHLAIWHDPNVPKLQELDPKMKWFKHWHCPQILTIELWGFACLRVSNNNDESEGGGEDDGDQEPGLEICENAQEQPDHTKDSQEQLDHAEDAQEHEKELSAQTHPYHILEDQEFLDIVSSQGWTYEEDAVLKGYEYRVPMGIMDLRNMIFERIWSSPNAYKVAVEGFEYVNKSRMRVHMPRK